MNVNESCMLHMSKGMYYKLVSQTNVVVHSLLLSYCSDILQSSYKFSQAFDKQL